MILRSLSAFWTSAAPGVADHLWQSSIFVLLAAMLAFALRKNQARIRYGVWLAASVKFLIPFTLLMTFGSHLAKPRTNTPTQTAVYSAVEDFSQPFAEQETLVVPQAQPSPSPINPLRWLPPTIVTIWLGGVVVVLLIWATSWFRVSLMMRGAVALREGREVAALRRMEARLGLDRAIRLVLSRNWMEPGIFGILRPVLIWPEGISQHLDERHIDAILAHEIHHTRRRDNLTAAFHMVVEAVFWFHPLVWWVGRRLEEERERACDEEVSLLCQQPQVYAESILRVCKFCSESPLACVSGITGADLKKRIVQIMTDGSTRKLDFGRKLLLLVVGLTMVLVPVVLGQAKATQRLMLAAIKTAPKPLQATARSIFREIEIPSARLLADAQASTPNADAAATQIGTIEPKLKFDVVSIKPIGPDELATGWGFTPDELEVNGASPAALLGYVYQLQFVQERILGGPDWAHTQGYDIRAKVSVEDAAAYAALSHDITLRGDAQRRAMLRVLLEERFHLRAHMETRQGTLYDLVIAKGGLKAKASTSGEKSYITAHGRDHLEVSSTELSAMVPFFAQQLGHPVVDETGLRGKYDFTLDWQANSGDSSASDSSDPSQPSLFTALEDQVGLKLVAHKGPVPVLVLDQIEKRTLDGAELLPDAASGSISSSATQGSGAGLLEHDGNAASQPKFEVASVKRASEEATSGARGTGLGVVEITSQRASYRDINFRSLLMRAYNVKRFQISGPGWIDSDRYDVVATIPEGTPAEDVPVMLQNLLIERFQMKVRGVPKTYEGYVLGVGKGGAKLTPAAHPHASNDANLPDSLSLSFGDHPEEHMSGTTMPALANILSNELGGPVVDSTQLAGKFDISMPAAPGAFNTPEAQANTMTGLRDLGLTLIPGKVQLETIVVDKAEETPTEN